MRTVLVADTQVEHLAVVAPRLADTTGGSGQTMHSDDDAALRAQVLLFFSPRPEDTPDACSRGASGHGGRGDADLHEGRAAVQEGSNNTTVRSGNGITVDVAAVNYTLRCVGLASGAIGLADMALGDSGAHRRSQTDSRTHYIESKMAKTCIVEVESGVWMVLKVRAPVVGVVSEATARDNTARRVALRRSRAARSVQQQKNSLSPSRQGASRQNSFLNLFGRPSGHGTSSSSHNHPSGAQGGDSRGFENDRHAQRPPRAGSQDSRKRNSQDSNMFNDNNDNSNDASFTDDMEDDIYDSVAYMADAVSLESVRDTIMAAYGVYKTLHGSISKHVNANSTSNDIISARHKLKSSLVPYFSSLDLANIEIPSPESPLYPLEFAKCSRSAVSCCISMEKQIKSLFLGVGKPIFLWKNRPIWLSHGFTTEAKQPSYGIYPMSVSSSLFAGDSSDFSVNNSTTLKALVNIFANDKLLTNPLFELTNLSKICKKCYRTVKIGGKLPILKTNLAHLNSVSDSASTLRDSIQRTRTNADMNNSNLTFEESGIFVSNHCGSCNHNSWDDYVGYIVGSNTDSEVSRPQQSKVVYLGNNDTPFLCWSYKYSKDLKAIFLTPLEEITSELDNPIFYESLEEYLLLKLPVLNESMSASEQIQRHIDNKISGKIMDHNSLVDITVAFLHDYYFTQCKSLSVNEIKSKDSLKFFYGKTLPSSVITTSLNRICQGLGLNPETHSEIGLQAFALIIYETLDAVVKKFSKRVNIAKEGGILEYCESNSIVYDFIKDEMRSSLYNEEFTYFNGAEFSTNGSQMIDAFRKAVYTKLKTISVSIHVFLSKKGIIKTKDVDNLSEVSKLVLDNKKQHTSRGIFSIGGGSQNESNNTRQTSFTAFTTDTQTSSTKHSSVEGTVHSNSNIPGVREASTDHGSRKVLTPEEFYSIGHDIVSKLMTCKSKSKSNKIYNGVYGLNRIGGIPSSEELQHVAELNMLDKYEDIQSSAQEMRRLFDYVRSPLVPASNPFVEDGGGASVIDRRQILLKSAIKDGHWLYGSMRDIQSSTMLTIGSEAILSDHNHDSTSQSSKMYMPLTSENDQANAILEEITTDNHTLGSRIAWEISVQAILADAAKDGRLPAGSDMETLRKSHEDQSPEGSSEFVPEPTLFGRAGLCVCIAASLSSLETRVVSPPSAADVWAAVRRI